MSQFKNRRVLVTGGLGFIGSNLALKLAGAGAHVTVVDSLVAGCGANRHNLEGTGHNIRVIEADIRDARLFASELRDSSVIFNLAGEISHTQSMRDPARDAEINTMSQLLFLEECARQNPGVRVVYASTRQIYGVPQYLPVNEAHPIQPVDFNGIHKYAATAYHLLWSSMKQIDGLVLCLTNIYGPHLALRLRGQGFLSNFLRRALQGQTLQIYGDGMQLRDPVYVDDAVDAFLMAGAARKPQSRLWNVGGSETLTLAAIARVISKVTGGPEPTFRPFPEESKNIEIGSYTSDSGRIREELGWRPSVSFEQGVKRSIEFFQRELEHYVGPEDRDPDVAPFEAAMPPVEV